MILHANQKRWFIFYAAELTFILSLYIHPLCTPFQIKTFILAGHETSASMLTWALYELTQNSEYTRRVTAEADDVFGKGAKADTPSPPSEKYNDLVFTQCCLKVCCTAIYACTITYFKLP